MKHFAGRLDDNLSKYRKWFDKALKESPDFIGFPEFALTGWVYDRKQALTLNSPYLNEIDRLAQKHNVFTASGFVEKSGKQFYNTTLITGPKGRLGAVRKVNLTTGESRYYAPGREFPVFDVGGVRMGIAVCADATRFEVVHMLALKGAEVIFAPHASMLNNYGGTRNAFLEWRKERWRLFASDSCVYLAGINSAGVSAGRGKDKEKLPYCGGGLVVDYNGRVIAALGGGNKKEGMITVELDIEKLRKIRRKHTLSSEFRPEIVYNRKDGWKHEIFLADDI